MKLTYKLNREDYVAFNVYHIQNTKEVMNRLKIQQFLGAFGFVFVGIIISYFINDMKWIVLGLMSVMGIFWFIRFPNIAHHKIVKGTHKAMDNPQLSYLFEDMTLSITEDYIDIELKELNRVKWTDVLKVDEQDSVLYFWFSNNGSLIIPERFLSRDELDTLRGLIISNCDASRVSLQE